MCPDVLGSAGLVTHLSHGFIFGAVVFATLGISGFVMLVKASRKRDL